MPPKRTTTTITTTPMTDAAIKALIAQGVADALAEYEAHRSSGNGDDSHESGSGRRTERAARECTYSDFLKCQPLNFKGTEGVVSLTQWFEKMESVFHISNCTVACQIKFATCTLLGNALTWWNSHVKTVGHDAAYGMPWKTLKKMMTNKYCPRGEIKKLEIELWNLKFEESDEVEKRSVLLLTVKLKTKGSLMTTPETIRINISLSKGKMWQGPTLLGLRRRKRTKDLNLCAPNATTITMGSMLPSAPTERGLTILPGTDHFKRDCPKLKNNNRGNQAGNGRATTMVYAMGNAGKNPDANVVT
ncbi:putative reverse transcriptase domain-containing protein, partial [Tanacetum coccineum]